MQLKFVLSVSIYLILIGCDDAPGLKPFSSDGCSLFPDADLISHQDWCECCFQHDLAYWRGGTKLERKNADLKFKDCVIAKTNDPILAKLMYDGVRFGGSPYFYNWYRWGYGWPYQRKYQALTQKELQVANRLQSEYFLVERKNNCY